MTRIDILEEYILGGMIILDFRKHKCIVTVVDDMNGHVFTESYNVWNFDHYIFDVIKNLVKDYYIKVIKVNNSKDGRVMLKKLAEYYETEKKQVTVIHENQLYFTNRHTEKRFFLTTADGAIENELDMYSHLYDVTIKKESFIKMCEALSGYKYEDFDEKLNDIHVETVSVLFEGLIKLKVTNESFDIDEFVENYCK